MQHELQRLKFGDKFVRFFTSQNTNWFSMSDVCSCIGINKSNSSKYTKKISQEMKRKYLKFLYVTDDAVKQIVANLKTEQAKNMNKFISEFLEGKVDTENESEETDNESDVESEEIKDDSEMSKPTSPKQQPKSEDEIDGAIVPFGISINNPDIARMHFDGRKYEIDKKAELEKYKAELQYKLKEKQMDLAKKEADIKQWQFCNKKIFKYGTSMEKERFLNHARMIGDRLMVDYLPEKHSF